MRAAMRVVTEKRPEPMHSLVSGTIQKKVHVPERRSSETRIKSAGSHSHCEHDI
jgi:hypothetical protein